MKIGSLFSQIRNGASIKQEDSASGYPITRIETIANKYVDRTKMGYANITDIKPYESFILKDCDILMSHINSEKHLGKVAQYKKHKSETVIHGMNLLLLRPNPEKILSRYAIHYFESNLFKCALRKNVKKSVNQASFTISALKEVSIPLPSLEEQKRIATILDKANSIRQQRQESLALMDTFIKSVFLEMFGDSRFNTKGWAREKLSQHLNVIGGYAFKSESFVEEGIPVLRIGNINLGYFRDNNLVFWVKDKSLKKYLVYPGDLLISLTGTVGKDDYGNVCILASDYKEYYLNQRNAKLEICGNINKYYLMHLLKTPQVKGRLIGKNRGVRQANISNGDILGLEVPIPPIELQNKFADIVHKVEAQKTTMRQQLREAEDTFKALQQQFFG